jgi:SNF2 family DNA or RNA helicase
MELYDWFISKAELTIMPHQYEAVKRMLDNESINEIKGGILADEMGLGKTIMMIGLFITNYVKKTLIIVPAPLVNQWVSEIQRTTGHKILVWTSKVPLEALKKAPFVITTYNRATQEESELYKIKWDRIVFDEAHHMRNRTSARFKSGHGLKSCSKWLITGTPIHNSRKDFHSLCSVIGLPASYYTSLERREELLKKYYIRRTKAQVGIEIPGYHINKNKVEWKDENEMKLSKDIHESYYNCDRKEKLRMIITARQTCILPKMIKSRLPYLMGNQLLNKQYIANYVEGCKFTSKIDELVKIMKERKGNGNGKLVFCHFREEINLIARRLEEDGIKKIGIFDGRLSPKERKEVINISYDVLILQIQTGCEGINLQKNYNEIYFVSPNWNPAIEDQAVARCHRIGQTKEVEVFKFGSSGFKKEEETFKSLDNYISCVQKSKREIRKTELGSDVKKKRLIIVE